MFFLLSCYLTLLVLSWQSHLCEPEAAAISDPMSADSC